MEIDNEDIPSLVDLKQGSQEHLEVVEEILNSIEGVYVILSHDAMGHHLKGFFKGTLFRWESHTGIFVTGVGGSPDLGYVYDTFGQGISWLLCILGFGTSPWAFESESLRVSSPGLDNDLIVSFARKPTTAETTAYQYMIEKGGTMHKYSNAFMGGSIFSTKVLQ